jgi:integrase
VGNLTAFQVKHAKKGRHGDGKGLYLLVSPTGAKSWMLRVQVDGRRRDFGLGSLDLISLQEARDKALEGRKMAKAGFDPSLEWKKLRTALPTFEEAARRYHEAVKGGWRNSKHPTQWINTLEKYAFPVIGSTTVDKIDAPDIQRVLIPIWQTVPETARRVRQRVAVVLDYAKGQGWRSTEAPMRAVNSLMKAIKQPRKGNFAAMPYKEVPAFLQKLRDADQTIGRLALQFLILTAARSGEVRGATWGEIDLESGQWNLPASRMKMGEPHSVPLTAAASAVLEQARHFSTGSDDALIFPGLKRKPLSDMTLSKALKASGGDAFTVHGFRSSFRDWVAEQTSYPREWAEAALAHSVPNRVEAAYRRTKFLDQRRGMMNDWAGFTATTVK